MGLPNAAGRLVLEMRGRRALLRNVKFVKIGEDHGAAALAALLTG
jgi:hypothetical protein